MKNLAIALPLSLLLILLSCTNRDVPKAVDCATTDLVLVASTATAPTGCSSTDGVIIVTATGGKQPYTYSLNGATFQTANSFNGLGSGDYTIAVKDANLCERTLSVKLPAINSTLNGSVTTVSNSGCTAPNGSVVITASAGFSPYQYQLNTGGFVSTSTFTGLAAGTYNLAIKDSKGCVKTLSATVVTAPTTISYANEIATILTTRCNLAACHAAGSSRGDWTTYDNVKAKSASIKTRTASKSMPPSGSTALTQAQIDLIGCWVAGGAPNN